MKLTMHKKYGALLLALCFLLCLMMPVFADEAELAEQTEPTETEIVYETIYIENAEDLLELAENCRLDTWSQDKQVVLQADISLNETDFQPIPTFGGIFEGGGHTISGLSVTSAVTPAGLFSHVQSCGVIQNLNASGTVAPSGDADHMGGIVGENSGAILNCTFTGDVTGADSVGGIAGVNNAAGRIVGCASEGLLIGSDMTGGIAGCNLGYIGACENKASVNTVSTDPSVDIEDINLDFLTDVSKLTTMDTSAAAMDTGGIAGYSSGVLENCTNQAVIGYPHIGYNVGGIAGRSCGYIAGCENSGEIYGRKDVGGIAGQLEPYIQQNISESALAQLERQLEELDTLIGQAMEHADGAAGSISRRLNGIAGSMNTAGDAVQDIRTSGTVSGTVSGGGETSGEGSVTVTPSQVEAGASSGAGGSVSVEVSPGSGSIDVTTGTGGEIHGGLTEGGISGEGQTSGSGAIDAQTQIEVSTNLAGISSVVNSMAGQVSLLSGEISGASAQLQNDVQLIREKINEIKDTVFGMIYNEDDDQLLVDSSDTDIDVVTLGKAWDCVNSGPVQGDINIGGIAGSMALEYELDPEDDVTISIDASQRRQYELKAIIQRCENTGEIAAKRSYAGGITGRMDLGLITECGSYGDISSENGDYVGGIASSTIRFSFAKCSLSGGKYVGGIVGSGVEEDREGESSTVSACYAIVAITDYAQYAGAISGSHAGTYLENYFVSDTLTGIGRVSYSGQAEPISYQALLEKFEPVEETVPEEPADPEETEAAAEPEETEPAASEPLIELPEEFEVFTLKFVADGQVLSAQTFPYGASFGSSVLPDIPEKEGYYAYWDTTDLTNLGFDTTVTAVYEPYITALTVSDTRGAQSVFFVEGDFAQGDTLAAEPMALTPAEFDLVENVWDGLCKSFRDSRLNTAVAEQWHLQIPNDGRTVHAVRYLAPDGDPEQIDVYVRMNGNWVKTDTEVIGSYVTFWVQGGNAELAFVRTASCWWVWLIAAALVAVLLVLLIRLIRGMIRAGKKPAPAGEQPQDPQ